MPRVGFFTRWAVADLCASARTNHPASSVLPMCGSEQT